MADMEFINILEIHQEDELFTSEGILFNSYMSWNNFS